MDKMPEQVPEPLDITYYPYRDELGRLFEAYNRMVAALHEKGQLERGMLAAERLAAVGRLTAGIAHEINNPLAGLLTAIDTIKMRDTLDPRSRHTLELVERGLHQIRDTVAALLVEARGEQRTLGAQDIEDIATLLESTANEVGASLRTAIDLPGPQPIPAGPVRQILINLINNALQAAGNQGRVEVAVDRLAGMLRLRVKNDGALPSAEQLEHLFEPFVTYREGGVGLGLWVTYQLVEQLHGRIRIETAAGQVEILVELPVSEQAAAA
jgi:signal transduction histidine kinase